MKRTKFKLLALGAVLSLMACSKKDNTTTPSTPSTPTTSVTPTVPSLIGSWIPVSIKSNIPLNLPDTSLEYFTNYSGCSKDDYYIYKNDGTMDYNFGTNKCDPSEPPATTFKYMRGGNTIIVTYGVDTVFVKTILKLTADTLIYTEPSTKTSSANTDTIRYISTATLIKK